MMNGKDAPQIEAKGSIGGTGSINDGTSYDSGDNIET